MSNKPTQPLDAFTFPLHGTRLIEASAGTGKTYTIANLYLRIILGHGDEQSRHETNLTADQILVVTFTEAATGELRDRIRARIHKARLAFIDKTSDDDFIKQLLSDYQDHDKAIELLLTAERQMDEAAIFTIHGFCQRMLKQHAFESGTLFTSELISDNEQLLHTAAADYWRKYLYPLDQDMAAMVRELWKTPDKLLAAVRSWMSQADLNLQGDNLPESLSQFKSHCLQPWLNLKENWQKDAQAINDALIDSDLAKNKKPWKRLEKMNAFIRSSASLTDHENWEVFSTAGLEDGTKKNGKVPVHSIFQQIDDVLASTPAPKPALKAIILRDAFLFIKQQLRTLMSARHQLSFDDLLGNLAAALKQDRSEHLSTAIRDQFRIAMIDEFQDTDPLQYTIFRKIYMESCGDKAGLFMIGDPKQAIYAFRGADIFTYMQAREQSNERYSLGTNWRSTSAMIESVNTVFSSGKEPFIYNATIPFEPVQSSPKADERQLLDNGSPLPALQLWLQENDGQPVGSTDYEEAMTTATAAEIQRLLTAADQGQCVIKKNGKAEPLQPGDIAVLVRKGSQGKKIRDALQQQGIASIYLSNNDSVFTCQEAIDLCRILDACLAPTDERTLKAALASSLLNENAESLDRLNTDEQLWEQAVEEFRDYHTTWQRQGVLPMLRNLIHQRTLAERLVAAPYGERRLTDLLHLGELLSCASQELESPHALVRWLSEQIDNPNKNADEQQLHLESEQNLVKVVTIHKSKGLEYNVVFLPYVAGFTSYPSHLYHDEESKEAILDLMEQDESKAQAAKEQLAEDLRLLYVALTRSVHSCYLGLAPFKKGAGKKGAGKKDAGKKDAGKKDAGKKGAGNSKKTNTHLHNTAIGYLLKSGEEIDAGELPKLLDKLTSTSTSIVRKSLPVLPASGYELPESDSPELVAREFQTVIAKDWWVTSYSALSRNSHGASSGAAKPSTAPDASLESAGHDTEVSEQQDETPVADYTIFQFPKGARPGTFMHSLFEELDMANARTGDISDFIKQQLAKEGYEEHWQPALEKMVLDSLNAPLDGKDMRLLDIPEPSRCVEMEFYLPVNHLDKQSLNQLIRQHDPLSQQAGELDFARVKGMLKGFIDLTFEYQGRWYVLDYKSNWLGEQVSDYSQKNMQAMMVDHRYDLQYQLYSLALHRLLKQRLPDYDYDQHFGGAIYLFLRGVRDNDPQRHGIFEHRPSKQLIEQLDSLFAGEEEYQP